jgi:hypothetical protein
LEVEKTPEDITGVDGSHLMAIIVGGQTWATECVLLVAAASAIPRLHLALLQDRERPLLPPAPRWDE